MGFSRTQKIFPEKTFDLTEVFALVVEYQGACKVDLLLDDVAIQTFTFNNVAAAYSFVTEQQPLTSWPAYGRVITLKAYDGGLGGGNVRKLDLERRYVLCGSDNKNMLFTRLLPFNDFGKPTTLKEFYKTAITYKTGAAKTMLLDVFVDRSNISALTAPITLPTSVVESRMEIVLANYTLNGAPVVGKNIAFKFSATTALSHQGWVYGCEMLPENLDVIELVAGGQ